MPISTTAISVPLIHYRHHHHVRIGRSCNSYYRASARSSSRLRCLTTASVSGSNSGELEESRWIREEQRWLREEQRWLREESRWISERESLLNEISILRLRLQQLDSELKRYDSLSDSSSQSSSLPQTTFSLPSPQSDPPPTQVDEQKDLIIKEVIVDDDFGKQTKATNSKRNTLRFGCEGQEVREMQEALLKLGFYSGEEEMEFSTFSTRTHRAVKTWQATLGAPEDGIMSEELLKRLYMSLQTDIPGSLGIENGPAVKSVTAGAKKQQTVVEKKGMNGTDVSQHRVFLLGENRWEEPSRVVGNVKQASDPDVQDSVSKCLACRGEGRLMCTECDGTGEPNIEPQFSEWVDEGTKCPYCEGLGYTACDICVGSL